MLHRSLCDTNDFFREKDLRPKKPLYDMAELIAEVISCSSSKFCLQSFCDAAQFCRDGSSEDALLPQEVTETENVTHIDPIEDLSSDRHVLLGSLNNTVTASEILLAMLQSGSSSMIRNPSDFAICWCMYALFSFVLKIEKSEETTSNLMDQKRFMSKKARQCLLQCLTISNQVLLTGITGWFEYGSVTGIDHFTGQPFTILQQLAYEFARDQEWTDAESVCRAMVICCEQHLPLHHPTTITSLLDLSVSSSMIGNQRFANRILSRAAEYLSKYLFEMETLYSSHLSKARSSDKPGHPSFRIEHGRDAIFELRAFASQLQRQLTREMVSLIDADNEAVVANQCFVADALSVLANCTSAAHFFLGCSSEENNDSGRQYWRLAYRHYEHCYNIRAATRNLNDPFVVRSLFGVARCLREFGETANALKLLSIVVSFRENDEERIGSAMSDGSQNDTVEESKEGSSGSTGSPTPRFLPISTISSVVSNVNLLPKSMLSALCLWLMSILSVDQKGDEEGRERAFGYLHAASVLLQASLHKTSDLCDDSARAMCIRFLSMIEDEAELISEPMYE
jgi:hypothetical protein